MNWINFYGLAVMLALMVPNILYAVRVPEGFQNLWKNRAVEAAERVGRIGCFGFMVLTVPGWWTGFPSEEAFAAYLVLNGVLTVAYLLIFALNFRKSGRFRALALSILPSAIFLLSGVLSRYLPLCLSAVLFAPCHILISYRNAVLAEKQGFA